MEEELSRSITQALLEASSDQSNILGDLSSISVSRHLSQSSFISPSHMLSFERALAKTLHSSLNVENAGAAGVEDSTI